MSSSDFYAKFYNFLFNPYLIQAFFTISTFMNLFAEKCIKPKVGLSGLKMEKQNAISDFHTKINNLFHYEFLIRAYFENLDLFAKKYVRPKVAINGKKMEKQKSGSDFYA